MRWGAAFAAAVAMSSSMATAQPRWTTADLAALRDVVASAPSEGLPEYDAGPMANLQAGDLTDILAEIVALKLARDFYEGSAQVREDRSWHIDRAPMDYRAWLDTVLAHHSIVSSFQALLPKTADYHGLREALRHCATPSQCGLIAVNLDRLRAMPRDLGQRYLWVNVPAFRLDLIENGHAIASHRVIVGKPGSQTPSFAAKVTGVTINPWWNVPCSIVDESVGKLVTTNPAEAAKRGYVASRDAHGKLVVRQRPGPDNALGQIKLEMPNPYDVYIHDTPSKNLFTNSRRAFSHGCIRTEDPHGLAVSLLGSDQEATVNLLLATGVSRTIRLAQPLPVYVVYLTAEATEGGEGPTNVYPDIYRRDGR